MCRSNLRILRQFFFLRMFFLVFFVIKFIVRFKHLISFWKSFLNFFVNWLIIKPQSIIIHFLNWLHYCETTRVSNIFVAVACITLFDFWNWWINKICYVTWRSVCKKRFWVRVVCIIIIIHFDVPLRTRSDYRPCQRIFINFFSLFGLFHAFMAFMTFLRVNAHFSLNSAKTLPASTATWTVADNFLYKLIIKTLFIQLGCLEAFFNLLWIHIRLSFTFNLLCQMTEKIISF